MYGLAMILLAAATTATTAAGAPAGAVAVPLALIRVLPVGGGDAGVVVETFLVVLVGPTVQLEPPLVSLSVPVVDVATTCRISRTKGSVDDPVESQMVLAFERPHVALGDSPEDADNRRRKPGTCKEVLEHADVVTTHPLLQDSISKVL